MKTNKPLWQQRHGRLRDETWFIVVMLVCFNILLVVFLTNIGDGQHRSKDKPWVAASQPIRLTPEQRERVRSVPGGGNSGGPASTTGSRLNELESRISDLESRQ